MVKVSPNQPSKSQTKKILEHNYIAIKKCKHGYFAYNQNDSIVGRSLDLYGEWAESELDILSQVIHPGDTIVDIGAYIGTHTVFFAQTVGINNGNVIAIEPQRLAYYLLCTNVTLNTLNNVSCLNAAVADMPGHRPVPNLDPTMENNFGALRLEDIEVGTPTQVITLDQLNLNRVNLIKIDVEQMETKVIQGGENTINSHRPIMFVENTQTLSSPPLLKILKKFDYQAYWHIFPHYNPDNYFNNSDNVFSQLRPDANLLCIPKERSSQITGFEPVKDTQDDWFKAISRMEKKHAKKSKPKP